VSGVDCAFKTRRSRVRFILPIIEKARPLAILLQPITDDQVRQRDGLNQIKMLKHTPCACFRAPSRAPTRATAKPPKSYFGSLGWKGIAHPTLQHNRYHYTVLSCIAPGRGAGRRSSSTTSSSAAAMAPIARRPTCEPCAPPVMPTASSGGNCHLGDFFLPKAREPTGNTVSGIFRNSRSFFCSDRIWLLPFVWSSRSYCDSRCDVSFVPHRPRSVYSPLALRDDRP
jgi:hypothetical protein